MYREQKPNWKRERESPEIEKEKDVRKRGPKIKFKSLKI